MIKKTSAPQAKNRELQNKLNLFLRRYFSAFVLLFVVVLLYAGFMYIIQPKMERGDNMKNLLMTNKENDKRMLEGALEKLVEYQLAYERVSQAEKDRVKLILPGREGRENLFTELESFVLRQGLILDSLDFEAKSSLPANSRQKSEEGVKETPRSGEAESINLSLKISGVNSYQRLKEFLGALENNLRLMDVNDIKYDQSGGTLSLEVSTYYLPQDK